MGDRLILDTGVLIAASRGRLNLSTIVTGDDDVVISAVTVAEYLTGVELAGDERQRIMRRAWFDDLLTVTPVEDYTPTVAGHHAVLIAHCRRTGQPRGPLDLIIAATARSAERTLISTDRKARFEGLPGVDARLILAE